MKKWKRTFLDRNVATRLEAMIKSQEARKKIDSKSNKPCLKDKNIEKRYIRDIIILVDAII